MTGFLEVVFGCQLGRKVLWLVPLWRWKWATAEVVKLTTVALDGELIIGGPAVMHA